MQTVTVNASTRYEVLIEKGLLSRTGELTANVFDPSRSAAAIITDDTVAGLYLRPVVESLKAAGFRICSMDVPHGEDSKSHEVLLQVYDFLIQNNITRSDFVVALGGGVVGDLAGFAAATYLRGIPFVQIPTTFLGRYRLLGGRQDGGEHPGRQKPYRRLPPALPGHLRPRYL